MICFMLIFMLLTGCTAQVQEHETRQDTPAGESVLPSIKKNDETADTKQETTDKAEQDETKHENDVEDEDTALRLLESMTLEQKIGQLFTIPLAGEELSEADAAQLTERYFGNTFLFGKSTKDIEKIKQLNLDTARVISDNTGLSPFIFIDQEGGRVRRIKDGITYLPTAREMGMMKSEDVYELAFGAAEDMRELGITCDTAPVLDVFTNINNTVIGDRAFGNDPMTVTNIGCAFMDGLTDGGLLACVKHFPGHGDTTEDSHYELPVLEHDMERLEEVELVPFKAAIEAGCKLMMVAHIVAPALSEDGLPASLSGEVMSYIRDELEYDGLIITDSMDMKAVSDTYGVAKASLMAIMAGADLVCASEDYELQNEAYDLVLSAARDGTLSIDTIDTAVLRIISLKLDYFGLEK